MLTRLLRSRLDASLERRLTVEVRVAVTLGDDVPVAGFADVLRHRGWEDVRELPRLNAITARTTLAEAAAVATWSGVEHVEEAQPVTLGTDAPTESAVDWTDWTPRCIHGVNVARRCRDCERAHREAYP